MHFLHIFATVVEQFNASISTTYLTEDFAECVGEPGGAEGLHLHALNLQAAGQTGRRTLDGKTRFVEGLAKMVLPSYTYIQLGKQVRVVILVKKGLLKAKSMRLYTNKIL